MSRYEDPEYARNYKTEAFRHKMRNYYVIIMILLLLLALVSSLFRSPKQTEIGFEGYERIDDMFCDAKGKPFDFDQIDSYATTKKGAILAYYTLGDDLKEGQSLVFRSKNMTVKVLVNGKLIYKSQDIQAPLSMLSPGTRWNFVQIPLSNKSGTVELQMKRAYQDGKAKVDSLYFGDRAEIMKTIVNDKMFVLVLSLVIFVLGIIYMVIDILLNGKKIPEQKTRALFYLGFSASQIAIWCVLETNLLQLFVPDVRVLQMVDNMMLIFGGLSMYMYMDCEYDIFKNKWLRIPAILDFVYAFVTIVLHVVRIRDLHQMILGAVVHSMIIAGVMIGCTIHQSIYYKNSNDHIKMYYRMQQIGVIGLVIGSFVDIARYFVQDTIDRAFGIRIGMVFFVISFGIGNIRHLVALAKQGENAGLMRALAYNDSLTGVENRNSFEQRLDELTEENHQILGIVMCDVNNLKQINDVQGHQLGDALIRTAAEIICDSFGKFGTVYRIGGDEFCVLIEKNDAAECYRQAKRDFNEKLKQYNRYYSFKISIAHGVAYCVDFTKEGITRAQKEADEVMYKNKRYIKIKEHRAMR